MGELDKKDKPSRGKCIEHAGRLVLHALHHPMLTEEHHHIRLMLRYRDIADKFLCDQHASKGDIEHGLSWIEKLEKESGAPLPKALGRYVAWGCTLHKDLIEDDVELGDRMFNLLGRINGGAFTAPDDSLVTSFDSCTEFNQITKLLKSIEMWTHGGDLEFAAAVVRASEIASNEFRQIPGGLIDHVYHMSIGYVWEVDVEASKSTPFMELIDFYKNCRSNKAIRGLIRLNVTNSAYARSATQALAFLLIKNSHDDDYKGHLPKFNSSGLGQFLYGMMQDEEFGDQVLSEGTVRETLVRLNTYDPTSFPVRIIDEFDLQQDYME